MASNETVEEIVKEMRQVPPYCMYRLPVFGDPRAVSPFYAKTFIFGKEGGYFARNYADTIDIQEPKIKEVSNHCLADRIKAAHEREIAKLRTLTTHTDNSEVISELERRLKVAKNALKRIWNSNSINLDVAQTAYEALAAIRGEGGAK